MPQSWLLIPTLECTAGISILLFSFFSYIPFWFFQYVLVICSIIMTKVCSFLFVFFCLFLCRHILAALHFNYNLHRDDKVNEDDSVPLKLSYRKFKNGEATVRSQKVEQNFGKQITFITLYFNKPTRMVLWHWVHSVANSLALFFSQKVNFDNKIILIAMTQISSNSSYRFYIWTHSNCKNLFLQAFDFFICSFL